MNLFLATLLLILSIILASKRASRKILISIISFLKPGIIKIYSKSGEEKFYVEDGIIEFKNNNLSVLTSSIFNLKDMEKNKIEELLKSAQGEIVKAEINDQTKYLIDQKIEVLRSIN